MIMSLLILAIVVLVLITVVASVVIAIIFAVNSNNKSVKIVYCPECGMQLNGDSKFCTKCGKSM